MKNSTATNNNDFINIFQSVSYPVLVTDLGLNLLLSNTAFATTFKERSGIDIIKELIKKSPELKDIKHSYESTITTEHSTWQVHSISLNPTKTFIIFIDYKHAYETSIDSKDTLAVLRQMSEEVMGANIVPSKETSLEYIQSVKKFLENIIAALPANVYCMDRNGINLGCNENVLKLHHLDRAHYIGKTYADLYPPKLVQQVKAVDDSGWA